MQSIPGVEQAVVLIDPRHPSNLLAVLISSPEVTAPPPDGAVQLQGEKRTSLIAQLPRWLPEWAAPGRIFAVTRLPRTTSGKVDKAALLPLVAPENTLGERITRKSDRLVDAVLAAFRRILNAPGFGLDDNFFDEGGDSLSALALVTALEETVGTRPRATLVFNAPTPRKFAECLTRNPHPERSIQSDDNKEPTSMGE